MTNIKTITKVKRQTNKQTNKQKHKQTNSQNGANHNQNKSNYLCSSWKIVKTAVIPNIFFSSIFHVFRSNIACFIKSGFTNTSSSIEYFTHIALQSYLVSLGRLKYTGWESFMNTRHISALLLFAQKIATWGQ